MLTYGQSTNKILRSMRRSYDTLISAVNLGYVKHPWLLLFFLLNRI